VQRKAQLGTEDEHLFGNQWPIRAQNAAALL
jgi:hypothetical protein